MAQGRQENKKVDSGDGVFRGNVRGYPIDVKPVSAFVTIVCLAIFLQAVAQKRADETRSPKRAQLTTGNLQISYLEWNSSGRETVILLHGLYDEADSWKDFAPLLAKNYRVIALDRRGSGRSGKPLDGYDIPTLANDVSSFMTKARIRNAHIVGHSAGAGVALALAANHPAKVRSVVLVDGGFWPKRPHDPGGAAAPNCDDDDCRRSLAIEAGNREYDPEQLYSRVRLPVLLVFGIPPKPDSESNAEGLSEAKKLVEDVAKRKLRDGRYVLIENSGHWIYRDRPHELSRAILNFYLATSR